MVKISDTSRAREEQMTTLGGEKVPIARRFLLVELQECATGQTRDIMLGTTKPRPSEGQNVSSVEHDKRDTIAEWIIAQGADFCKCLLKLLEQNTTKSEMLYFLEGAGVRARERQRRAEQIVALQKTIAAELSRWMQEEEQRDAATDLVA